MNVLVIIFVVFAFLFLTYLDLRRMSRYEKRDVQRTNAQMDMISILEEIRDGISYKE